MSTHRMKFVEARSDVLSVVEIRGPLGAGPQLWGTALFGPHTQVTSAEFRVEGNRLVQRLHLAEVDEGARMALRPRP